MNVLLFFLIAQAADGASLPRGMAGVLLRMPWGRSTGQAGRAEVLLKSDPTYSLMPEGPYRILGGRDGSIVVVDTALSRIQIKNLSSGAWSSFEWTPEMGRKSPLWSDAASGEKGIVAVLDRSNCSVLIFENGVFRKSFGEFIAPESIGTDSGGRFFVRDPGAGGMIIFDSDGQWLGMIRDLRFYPVVNEMGEIFGLNIDQGVQLIMEPVFSNGNLSLSARPQELLKFNPIGRGLEIYGAQICGCASDSSIIVAITEGTNGKAFQTYIYRVARDGKVIGLRGVPALNVMRVDSPGTIAIFPSGEAIIPGEDVNGLTLYRALP